MHRFNSKLALGGFIALCAAGAPSLAEDTAALQQPASSSALSDVKVARDKETGALRAPTAAESAELDAKAKTLAPTVVEIRRPVSTVENRADGSMVGKRSLADMDNLVLEATADGTTVMRHSNEAVNEVPTATADLPTE